MTTIVLTQVRSLREALRRRLSGLVPDAWRGQPAELWQIVGLISAQRFALYGIKAILILFLVNSLGWRDESAGELFGLFAAGVFASPLLGGWLADRWLGYRRSMQIGFWLMLLGTLLLMVPVTGLFLSGLGLFVLGSGLFDPSITARVGKLYTLDDPRRETGYTLYFWGINLGAFLSPLVTAWAAQAVGWSIGFGLSAIGVLGGLALLAQAASSENDSVPASGPQPSAASQASSLADRGALTSVERGRIGVIFVLAVFMGVFVVIWEQGWTSVTLYADRYIDRSLGGVEIPAPFFQSINPLLVLVMAPAITAVLARMRRVGREPSTFRRFGYGLLILGVSYVPMAITASFAVAGTRLSSAPIWLTFAVATVGEILVTPVGLSMVSRLAPARWTSVLMGAWVMFWAAGNYAAGWLAGRFEAFGNHSLFFGAVSGVGLLAGALFLVVAPRLERRV